MNISKIALVISSLFLSPSLFAGGAHWESLDTNNLEKKFKKLDFPKSLKRSNPELLKSSWFSAQLESQQNQGLKVLLPSPSGVDLEFLVWESSIMEPELAAKLPEIKTFKGHQVGNPNNSGRFDLANGVFHGVYQLNGKTVFIEPLLDNSIENGYEIYFKSDFMSSDIAKSKQKDFQCKVKGHNHSPLEVVNKQLFKSANPINLGDTLRTYRLAVATTGEYGQFFGSKENAVASVVTAINRVNDVFQRDLSVKLELVANNDKVVYIDPNSDPFNGNDNGETLISEVSPELEKNIGFDNYDIGHVFSTGGGGLAALGVVCSEAKAEGVTGAPSPTGDPFWIDYVAHELGHQFHAEHSFNGFEGACNGNRAESWAYEPGSGSTVMSYAGICGRQDIQNNSNAYFHTTSIEQIKGHITGSADACAQKSVSGNAIPAVNAGVDGVIPRNTPFKLTATATDSDSSDSLLYVWEQRDLGAASSSPEELVDDGKRPIFRSWEPSASASRYFPRLQEVLSGGALVKGEAWATTSRDLNFVVTVRDQKGGINSDAALIKVDSNAGPFNATFPVSSSHWAPESQQYAQWDVANTTAAPISCSNVDIKLSLDDGATFSILSDDTANDGKELVTLPADIASEKARFFIECSNQPFYAVTKAFRISSSGTTSTEEPGAGATNNAPVATNDTYTVDQDSSNNRLELLVNDRDQDGDSLRIASVSNISNGATVTISSDGQFVNYSPAAGFSGDARFDYVLSDAKEATASGSVAVTVRPTQANSAPVANADSFTVEHDASDISLDLLANDSDPDSGDSLKITGVSSITGGATVTIADNGSSVIFTSASGFSGQVTFNYSIEDNGGATASSSVTITVEAAAPAPTPAPPASGGGSGGGSANWLLLGLLVLVRRLRK